MKYPPRFFKMFLVHDMKSSDLPHNRPITTFCRTEQTKPSIAGPIGSSSTTTRLGWDREDCWLCVEWVIKACICLGFAGYDLLEAGRN